MPDLSVPLSILQYPGYFTDLDGQPLSGGFIQAYAAGTTDPLTCYADCNGDAALSNPIPLDSSGFCAIFLQPFLYDFVVYDADMVQLYTREGVGNPGQIVAASAGNIQSQGSKNVDSGYTILSTDNLVTVTNASTTNPCVINLPAASARVAGGTTTGLALTIKNLSAQPLSIVPNGSDSLEDDTAAYAVPAAVFPLLPTITIVSDGESSWYITGGIGIT